MRTAEHFAKSRRFATATVLLVAAIAALYPASVGARVRVQREISPQEIFRYGEIDDPTHSLTRVGGVVIAPDGSVLFGQPLESRVIIIDQQGRLLSSFGRSGQGPGEFGGISALSLHGDTLLVSDDAFRRLSYFTTDGQFIKAVPWSITVSRSGSTASIGRVPEIVLADGSGLSRPVLATSPDAFPDDIVISFLRSDARGQGIDTIVAWNQPIPPMSTIFSNGRSFPLPYQFSDHRLSTFAMDGTGVIAVDREAPGSAAAGAFSVTKFSPTGDTIFKRQYPYIPKAMPEAEVARIVRETRSRFERFRRSPTLELDVEPPSAAQIERALRERGIPRFLTPITSVQSGQDGTIWLGGDDSSSETRRWYVIDTHGALVATATLPRRETVIAARDQLLITTYTDDLDVPYVAGYLLPET